MRVTSLQVNCANNNNLQDHIFFNKKVLPGTKLTDIGFGPLFSGYLKQGHQERFSDYHRRTIFSLYLSALLFDVL